MDNLEKYIKDNLEEFNQGEMPQGHKELFLEKLETASKSKNSTSTTIGKIKISRLVWGFSSAAAIIVIALFLSRPVNKEISVADENGIEYTTIMTTLENEIIDLSKKSNKRAAKEALKASRSVTFEAIPITEQLPKELSERERARILRKYYKEKTDGLKRIKTYLAEQSIEEQSIEEE